MAWLWHGPTVWPQVVGAARDPGGERAALICLSACGGRRGAHLGEGVGGARVWQSEGLCLAERAPALRGPPRALVGTPVVPLSIPGATAGRSPGKLAMERAHARRSARSRNRLDGRLAARQQLFIKAALRGFKDDCQALSPVLRAAHGRERHAVSSGPLQGAMHRAAVSCRGLPCRERARWGAARWGSRRARYPECRCDMPEWQPGAALASSDARHQSSNVHAAGQALPVQC